MEDCERKLDFLEHVLKYFVLNIFCISLAALAGSTRQPSPLSPQQIGSERTLGKEAQSCELPAAPYKQSTIRMKATAFQKGNDMEYVTWGVVRKIFLFNLLTDLSFSGNEKKWP